MINSTNVLRRILMVGFLVSILGTLALGNTIAYWRFDDQGDPNIEAAINDGAGGTVGNDVGMPDTDGLTVYRPAARDWSGNGNTLVTYEYSWAGFKWSDWVPSATVPKLGYTNTYSMQNTGTYPAAQTWSAQSHPGGVDLETWKPTTWTIEASFETHYTNGNHTFIGRDDRYLAGSNAAALYFAVRNGGYLGIEFRDADGYWHIASVPSGIQSWKWYNVAATSDGSTLKLYINGQLAAATDMTLSGTTDTSLPIGTQSYSGTWSVGRGFWAGGHSDRFYGNIDEVRFSDKALTPDKFLFPIPPVFRSGTVIPKDLGNTGLPWQGSLGWDTDQDPPEGSEDGGSVWGNGAFYSDVQGSAAGGGRDYTALRINLENFGLCGRSVQLGEIDSISYYTNMEPNSPLDWQLKIYTKPLDGQTSGWYGTRLNFTRGDNPDGNWDLWDTDTYTVSDIRDGQTGTMTYPNQLLSDIVTPYAPQYIQFMDIIASYATNSPACYSYLDAVTIKLKNGTKIKLDLEASRPPTCSTHEPLAVMATSATLAGAIVDTGGLPCDYRFRYTPAGGAELTTPWKPFVGSVGIYMDVDGLLDNTNYTYQMEIRNAVGSDLGGVRSFTTISLPQVMLSSSDGGSVVDPGEGLIKLVNQGDTLDVNAVAQEGYVFSQWAGTAVDQGKVADPTSAATSVQVTGALTLKALFKPVKIIWVTDAIDVDSNGVQDDQGWVDWLRSAGYVVEDQPGRYQKLGDEKDANDANDYVAELNSAALVIISRSSSSGSYASDANEIAAWNSIETPMICLSAYHLRNNRWDWIDSGTAVSDNSLSYLSVDDANSPIFQGVSIDGGLVDFVNTAIYGDGYQGTTFVDTASMGNAHVLGSYLLGYPWIAEWNAGEPYYDGSSQVAGGKRMMFLAGTQETKSNGIYYPQGAMNLTPDGQKTFLNAIDYMMSFNLVKPDDIFVKHLYTFNDDTANDQVGDANGVLKGGAYIADGALMTTAQGDYMSIPGDKVAINTYHAVSIEAWFIPVGDNTGCTMLAYLGDSLNGYGSNGFFMSPAQCGGVIRAAISVGNTTAPWTAETSVGGGPGYDDGLLHHMVCTIDSNSIALYIDGVQLGDEPLAAHNFIAGLSNNFVYLAKSGYTNDPQWMGAIQKFTIYNKALSPSEVLFQYLQGDGD